MKNQRRNNKIEKCHLQMMALAGVGLFSMATGVCYGEEGSHLTYKIVDAAQVRCYDDREQIEYPLQGDAFFGQDAQYQGAKPSYTDNDDGTVSDNVTGLMWTKSPLKKNYEQALEGASECSVGGYDDWRLPTIKELYSLIMFNGTDPELRSRDQSDLIPFIDTSVFEFEYGDASKGERVIDAQYVSSTKYVHTTMRNDDTVFGVNFADGRIKGYPVIDGRRRAAKQFCVLYVRGGGEYGVNKFKEKDDEVIDDKATGLTWMKLDSGHLKAGRGKDGKLNWQEALKWAEDLEYGGYTDWRLPNAKELQSIVDYTRSPETTDSAAINPLFQVSEVKEGKESDYPYYWTSTTHKRGGFGKAAVYICFGKGYGWMQGRRSSKKTLMDVHGAGCQRSDPKSGDPSNTPYGKGPQGDVLRIYNFVRCVRGGEAAPVTSGPEVEEPREKEKPDDDGPPRPGRGGMVDRLDKDGDGKVSKREFDGPREHFSHLDKDGDGYISEEEFSQGPPPKGSRPPRRRR